MKRKAAAKKLLSRAGGRVRLGRGRRVKLQELKQRSFPESASVGEEGGCMLSCVCMEGAIEAVAGRCVLVAVNGLSVAGIGLSHNQGLDMLG